jgi:hypothetical protein
MKRPLNEIAFEIRKTWPKPYFGAIPYIEAMFSLDKITDSFGYDSGESIVSYFLANAKTWRGEDAKRIKAELNSILKEGKKS